MIWVPNDEWSVARVTVGVEGAPDPARGGRSGSSMGRWMLTLIPWNLLRLRLLVLLFERIERCDERRWTGDGGRIEA